MKRKQRAKEHEVPSKSIEEHVCAELFCGKFGSFGLGPPIQPQQWWCREHLPADYWSRK